MEKNKQQAERGPHKGFGETDKQIDEFDSDFHQNTSFFSSWNPDTIEKLLKNHLSDDMQIQPVVSPKKYKIKFDFESRETLDADQPKLENSVVHHKNSVCVRIMKVDEDKVCVEFTNLQGPPLQFLECFNIIKENVLNFTNDATF